jgi:dihydropteroate synthase
MNIDYTSSMGKPAAWRLGNGRTLTLDQPRLMGILNVTPDSFSDGGLYSSAAAAVGHGLRLEAEGAAIIDIGGESTRPGAGRVEADEQIRRTIPVIRQLRDASDVLISVDTTSPAVAEAALDAGADIVNDTSAGRDSGGGMFTLAAERDCGLILMHRRARPESESFSDAYAEAPAYEDVVSFVRDFLLERCDVAAAAGVDAEAIVVDPGLGFGKTVEQNFQLIARISSLVETGYPVLSAASRKSFVGAASDIAEARQRVIASTAISVTHCLAGVRLFRVHDVAAHREAVAVAMSIAGATPLASVAPM